MKSTARISNTLLCRRNSHLVFDVDDDGDDANGDEEYTGKSVSLSTCERAAANEGSELISGINSHLSQSGDGEIQYYEILL